MRGQCFSAKGNSRIEINHNLQRLKVKARENLDSKKGKEIYAKICIDPEPVFGTLSKTNTLNDLPLIN